MLKKIKSFFPAKAVDVNPLLVPDDWIVASMGQNPVHCLWYCEIYNMETKQYFAVEEHDTPNEAIAAAVALINGGA
jgi:hypothetical protein